ncbi:MAG: hypothetical protein ACXWUP_14815 [Allosphingosinicella sp.]
MSKSALLDLLPDARRQTILHEEDGRAWIESRQDVAPVVAAARLVAEAPPGRDFRHAAFIPESELNRAFTEGWFHDAAAWKRWANDPANACYRTWNGRL